MTDSERFIGIKVNPDTKTRWQQAAEENPEYRSLTHFIAVAVEAELGEQPDTGGEVDVDAWRDWEDDLIVEVPLKVYGDTRAERQYAPKHLTGVLPHLPCQRPPVRG